MSISIEEEDLKAIPGGTLFALPWILFGFLVYLYSYYVNYPYLKTVNWSHTTAVVTSGLDYRCDISPYYSGNRYKPTVTSNCRYEVQYMYGVGYDKYTGVRYAFKPEISSYYLDHEKYATGKEVDVLYDSNNPRQSVLQRGRMYWTPVTFSRILFAFAGLILLIPLYIYIGYFISKPPFRRT